MKHLKKVNSLNKGNKVPLLNFEGRPGVPFSNFEGGPGVPFSNFEGDPRVPILNFRAIQGPTFKL